MDDETLKARLFELNEIGKAIQAKARAEKRGLSVEEKTEVDAICDEIQEVEAARLAGLFQKARTTLEFGDVKRKEAEAMHYEEFALPRRVAAAAADTEALLILRELVECWEKEPDPEIEPGAGPSIEELNKQAAATRERLQQAQALALLQRMAK